MGRAARRRRRHGPIAGPVRHTGPADQIAGARWARRDAASLTFYTLPWPVWLSALFMVGIGVWVGLSAWADRNLFGVAGVMFFAFAGWIVRKAPRERTVVQRDPGELRVEEGLLRIRPRRVVPFDEIDGFVVEHNRARNLYRVVAVCGQSRVPIGRSFVDEAEVVQRVEALGEWMGVGGPPVDRRIGEDEDEDEAPADG